MINSHQWLISKTIFRHSRRSTTWNFVTKITDGGTRRTRKIPTHRCRIPFSHLRRLWEKYGGQGCVPSPNASDVAAARYSMPLPARSLPNLKSFPHMRYRTYPSLSFTPMLGSNFVHLTKQSCRLPSRLSNSLSPPNCSPTSRLFARTRAHPKTDEA